MRNSVFIVFFPFLFGCSMAKAQYGIDQKPLKIALTASLGTTNKNSPFGYGIGLDLSLNYRLSEELAISAAVGYGGLLTKDTSPIPDEHFMPAKALVKVFPTPQEIYLFGIIGAGIGLNKSSRNAFIFGGGVGYQWDAHYDLGLKYEAYQHAKIGSSNQSMDGQFAIVFSYHF
jgi:hypothetical protein